VNAKELHQRAMAIFDEVCDLAPDEQRRMLDDRCVGTPELRARLDAMLQQDDDADSIVDAVESGRMVAELLRADAPGNHVGSIPDQIGPYKIIRKVGEGGMGVIYEAEQESPRRRVALKVLKPSLVDRTMLKRFQHESHVLGQLQHPGIAQIHESGLADLPGGRLAYFAMEFVDGAPLDKYADAHGLDVRQRLELFARVCNAVQHAHQKGVIHRDLKPRNVLVIQQTGDTKSDSTSTSSRKMTEDPIGQPKILDFGIARVTDADLQTVTVQTEVGQVIGTLAYMSPEQITGRTEDLDTRCDVYALGVMLYELLAGRRPFDFSAMPMVEAVRLICDQEPSLLGTLDRSFRGDIESIVAKALEKDRQRRYGSAAEFAADIRRYLTFQPIEARTASTFYQIRKFTKRNRALVGGVAATFLALLGGVAGSGYYLIEARGAAARLESVVKYQAAMLKNIDAQDMGRNIVADLRREAHATVSADVQDAAEQLQSFEQVLSRINATTIANRALDSSIMSGAVHALDVDFPDQPELRADLRSGLIDIYENIGLYEQSLEQAQQEWETRRRLDGDDAVTSLESRQRICELQLRSGAYEDAADTARELFQTQVRVLGKDHLDTLVTQRLLGVAYLKLTKPQEALEQLRESLAGLERTVHATNLESLSTRAELGAYYLQQREYDQARQAYEFVLREYEKTLGPDDENTLSVLEALAQTHFLNKQYEPALDLSLRICKVLSEKKGADHPDTLTARMSLAETLTELRRFDEAEPVVTDTLERARRVLGSDHPSTIIALSAAMRLMLRLGRWDEAEEYGREALEISRRTLGRDNIRTLDAQNDLTNAYVKSGKHELAISQGRNALDEYKRVLGSDHRRTLIMQQVLAKAYMSAGKLEEAAVELEQIIQACRVKFTSTSTYAGSLGLGVTTLVNLNRGAEAEALARDLLKWCQNHACKAEAMGRCHLWIARTQLAQGHDTDAEMSLAKSIALMKGNVPEDFWALHLAQLLHDIVAIKQGEASASDNALVNFHSLEQSAPAMLPEDRNTILPEVRRLMTAAGISMADASE